MPITTIIFLVHFLSLVLAVLGFVKKILVFKLLAAVIFVIAVSVTAVLGFGINSM